MTADMTDESMAEYQLTKIAATLDLILAVLERAHPPQAAPAQSAPPPPPTSRESTSGRGRTAYCSCECEHWKRYPNNPVGCCECERPTRDGSRMVACGCRSGGGEMLSKASGQWRWVKGEASAQLAPVAEPDNLDDVF